MTEEIGTKMSRFFSQKDFFPRCRRHKIYFADQICRTNESFLSLKKCQERVLADPLLAWGSRGESNPPPRHLGFLEFSAWFGVWLSMSSAVWVTFVKNYKKFCSPCHFLYRTASKMGCKNPKEVPQREINGIGQRIHAIHATSSLSCRSCIKQWSTILIFFWHLRARHLFLISPSSNTQIPKNRVPKNLHKDKNIERNKTLFFLVMSFFVGNIFDHLAYISE